jgi:hypothetical protein
MSALRGTRTPAENTSGLVGLTLFPVLDLVLILATRLHDELVLALLVLPAAFAGAAFLLCSYSRAGHRWALRVTLACAGMCLFASTLGVLLGTVTSLYSGF